MSGQRAFWPWVTPALLTAAAVRLAVAASDRVPTADATAFLTSGQSLLSGQGYARYGIVETSVSPLVPALLAALARLTGDPTAGFSLHHVLWGTLLVLPVAAVGRAVGGDRAGWRSAWAAALCPGLAVAAGIDGGGSELPAVVALATALAVVLSRQARPDGWRALAVGGLVGVAYLSRADALPAAAVVLAALAVRLWRSRTAQRGRVEVAAAVLVAGLATVAVAAPWPAWVHEQSGQWQLTGKASDTSLAGWQALARHDRLERDALLYRLDDSGEIVRRHEQSLTTLVSHDPQSFLDVQRTNLGMLVEQTVVPDARWEPPLHLPPSWELVPLPGLLLAGWVLWRRRRDHRVQVLAAVAAANVAVTLTFFVQDRYLAPSVMVTCALVGVGLADLRSPLARRLLQTLLAALALLAVAAGTSDDGLLQRAEPVEQRAAGQLLAAATAPDDRVMTRSMTVRYYLGRRTVPFPYGTPEQVLAYACRKKVDYVVVDDKVAALRPQLADWLGSGPWPGLRLVHELTVDEATARVFAVRCPQQQSVQAGSLDGRQADGTHAARAG
jgi:4-amino-4-deoxy-L-arabinose transferase-like glycosyltransferase